MTKDDLKSGMIVVLRDGTKMMVLTDCYTAYHGNQQFCLIDAGGFMNSDEYNNDLLDEDGSVDYDIMKVYCNSINSYTYNMNQLDESTLLWDRKCKYKEPKEMTISEIEKQLGYSIKIVK